MLGVPGAREGECETPGDFMLGDFSLGSLLAAGAGPLPNLRGDTKLLPKLGNNSGVVSFEADLFSTGVVGPVVSRGEIVVLRGRIHRSVLGLRSPGEVDATSWANL